jgi:hypothetical protein
MTSLQTTSASSAPGSLSSRSVWDRSSRQRESSGHNQAGGREGSSCGPFALKGVSDSGKVVTPSRSSICCSASRSLLRKSSQVNSECQSSSESPQSSIVSLPDETQMKSPHSEYLSGHKVEQVEDMLHSSGMDTEKNEKENGMQSFTVESNHKSLLCAEVLSLKAILER